MGNQFEHVIITLLESVGNAVFIMHIHLVRLKNYLILYFVIVFHKFKHVPDLNQHSLYKTTLTWTTYSCKKQLITIVNLIRKYPEFN